MDLMMKMMKHMPSIKSYERNDKHSRQGIYGQFAKVRRQMILSYRLIVSMREIISDANIMSQLNHILSFLSDDFHSDQNKVSISRNSSHKSHRMAVNPRYRTEPVPYSLRQYANEDFLRNQKQKKMIEFSCLKLSFIITFSTAIGFGIAALIFYITVSSCSTDTSNIPTTLEMTVSPTIHLGHDFSLETKPLTSQEPTTIAQKSDQLQNELSFQMISNLDHFSLIESQ